MSYKFILDTSALDNESVEKLRQGGIISACNSGRFAFYATPILLSERLNFLRKGKVVPTAEAAVQLFADIRWQRLFNELGGREGLLTCELEGRYQHKNLFYNHAAIKRTIDRLLKGEEFDENDKNILKT